MFLQILSKFSPVQRRDFQNHCKTHMKKHILLRLFGIFFRLFGGFAYSAALNRLTMEAVGMGGRADGRKDGQTGSCT